ncbi:MAG: hypothetical protein L3K19_06565 [Thermoplasmata archaeon]|nr:hypothetical protein [Thermoplasmata archaeon]
MVERPKGQLEQLTLQVDRKHPDWNARQVEHELESLAPAVHGHWKDDTPNDEARLRQIQRWRKGYRNPPRPLTRLAFRHLWPVGERQREALEPGFLRGRRVAHSSHRIFLQNCSEETLREIRAQLGDQEVSYEPSLLPRQFAEIHWTKNAHIRGSAMSAGSREPLRFPLLVDFAVLHGTKRARLSGELVMDPEVGWTSFQCEDGQSKEIE